ncbi:hypothetical protein A1O1_06087 [Capronia coronata CBS 617.96]|uniref:Uncharacterized protein n=1 Tax=Capronia coronata CBS 617.96 TaxID=1182541 RepID=W9YTW9_9EURO|nr:uncharacterized protein A1O1_06087 [Capronia coronata CBS 617.96]EXJ85719.1 hypothetical protein A1O1_06087 [Capronia coronata CBS 617.96]
MSTHTSQGPAQLAFNLALVAYDYKFEERKPNQLLSVRHFVKQPQISGLLAQGTSNIVVPRIQPSEEEKSQRDDSIVGVWVGMRPSWVDQNLNDNTVKAGKGSSVSSNKGFPLVQFDKTALRVVVPLGKKTANYYSLVNPMQGLCTAYHKPIEEVFFFPEFRDDAATSAHARRESWERRHETRARSVNYRDDFKRLALAETRVLLSIESHIGDLIQALRDGQDNDTDMDTFVEILERSQGLLRKDITVLQELGGSILDKDEDTSGDEDEVEDEDDE